ncbi:outer membrane beta-barrel protein [Myroides odoratimimus]|uniref:Outer membrane protein beta-barrel domain-containing protein n=1 Tax=Myroides odoratimimus CIP 101113 TaxID=883154 RepID=A0AAV3F7W0_9FLAO|nr:outer membrane beta-barrel protein [Myroides odoratimimus]EHO15537.1 hypothetical protein HMPREF9715_00108 [Myroides odoratimimus CIP 101113]
MKKLLLTLLVILGISQSYGQEKFKRFNPGIRGGLNLSNVTNTGGDYHANFYAGVILPIRFTKLYELQPEVVYSRQGTNNGTDRAYFSSNFNGGDDLTLDYVDINVINKFYFGKINLQVGPGLAIHTNSNESNITPIDLTFNFGVGIDITKRLGVEVRWMPGMIDINDSGDYYGVSRGNRNTDDMRNNTFQVGAYFRF